MHNDAISLVEQNSPQGTKVKVKYVGKRLTSGGLDLDKMQLLMSEAFSKIKSAEKKEMVLVIGNTGAGKSTTVNYLLGCELQAEESLNGNIAVPIGEIYAEMGNDSESKTFYPEVFTNGKDPLLYCDCPGFLDNRGKEEKICVSINTQMAITLARNIKSVMVVVDINSLTTDRGGSFRKLSETLGLLLKNPEEVASSILFVFTKNPKAKPAQILKKVSELIASEEKKLKEKGSYISKFIGAEEDIHKTKLEQIEIERKLKILKLIKDNPDNIKVIDVFDAGESKSDIVQTLYKMRSVSKSAFDFDQYDDARVKFNEVIFDIGQRGTAILKKKIELPSIIEKNIEEKNDTEHRIDFYKNQIKKLQSGEKSDNIDAETAQLNKKLADNNLIIREINQQIDSLKEEIFTLRGELKKLDSDVPVTYWRDSVYEKRSSLGFLGWTLKVFEYRGIPFEKVIENCDSEYYYHYFDEKIATGAFYDSKIEPKKGIYSSTYKSKFYEDGCASVEIRVKSKDKPDNQKRISDIKNILPGKEAALKDLEERRTRIAMENGTIKELVSNLTAKDKDNKVAIENQIKSLGTSTRQLEEKIRTLENEIVVTKEELTQADHDFEVNAKLLEIVYNILKILDFKSALMDEFKIQYERLSQKKPEVVHNQNIIVESLICPISLQPYVDPVMAKCGHVFSRMEITTHLESSQEKECPCCRQPIQEKDLVPCNPIAEVLEKATKGNISQLNRSLFNPFVPGLGNSTLFPSATRFNLFNSFQASNIVPAQAEKSLEELKREDQELEKTITDFKYQLKRLEEERAKLQKQIQEKEKMLVPKPESAEQQEQESNNLLI